MMLGTVAHLERTRRNTSVALTLREVKLGEAPVNEAQLPLAVTYHDIPRLEVVVDDAYAMHHDPLHGIASYTMTGWYTWLADG
jgi:hypothetical protein